jgi:hypothetical protein
VKKDNLLSYEDNKDQFKEKPPVPEACVAKFLLAIEWADQRTSNNAIIKEADLDEVVVID